jgi:hypothetical protein
MNSARLLWHIKIKKQASFPRVRVGEFFNMAYSPFSFNPQSTGSSRQLLTNYYNNTGSAIAQGTPLSVTGTANYITPTDVTSQASVQAFVGYAYVRIPNDSLGPVISGGRLQNLQGYSFSLGDAIYMSVLGTYLQDTKPVDSSGNPVAPFVSGNIMIFAGVIVQNETNPSLQDLQILTQVLGVL